MGANRIPYISQGDNEGEADERRAQDVPRDARATPPAGHLEQAFAKDAIATWEIGGWIEKHPNKKKRRQIEEMQ